MDNPLLAVVAKGVIELRNDVLAVLERTDDLLAEFRDELRKEDDAGLDQEPAAGEGNTDSTGA